MKMAIEFPNGTAVSRFYSDGSGELLAVFQYDSDAQDWARAKVATDNKNGVASDLISTCMYDGKSTMHKAPETIAE